MMKSEVSNLRMRSANPHSIVWSILLFSLCANRVSADAQKCDFTALATYRGILSGQVAAKKANGLHTSKSLRDWLWEKIPAPGRVNERNAVGKLKEIEKALLKLNPETEDFRRLLIKKLTILDHYFSGEPGMKEYIQANRRLFKIYIDISGEAVTTGFPYPVEPKSLKEIEEARVGAERYERGSYRYSDGQPDRVKYQKLLEQRSNEVGLLREHGDLSSAHRLPGSEGEKFEKAREGLKVIQRNGGEIIESRTIPPGRLDLFLVAEKFALLRRTNPDIQLTPLESGLADKYEATIQAQRASSIPIQSQTDADTRKLAYLVSTVSDSVNTSKDGVQYLDSAHQSFDFEFVRDRFRYLLSEGAAPYSKALALISDVREGQANENYVDKWWFGEARATRSGMGKELGGGPLLIRKNDVANSAWSRVQEGIKSRILTERDVLKGGMTDEIINGRGIGISRPYDPANRERRQDIGPDGQADVAERTVGWQLVGMSKVGESNNPEQDEVRRRIFWSEAPVDGARLSSPERPGGEGDIQNGEFRIAQQSIDLRLALHELSPALRAQARKELDQIGSRNLSPRLTKLLQDALADFGEIDAARGEIVVGIEAIKMGRQVSRPFQWGWDPAGRNWVPTELVPRGNPSAASLIGEGKNQERKDEKPGEKETHVLSKCVACHAVSFNAATFDGRCTKGFGGSFTAAARRAISRRVELDGK
jgi:hypothetical protein